MPSQPGNPKRILIVEDEAAIAFELEDTLRDAGFLPVGPALSTHEASLLVAAGDLDAALVDVGMVEAAPEAILPGLVRGGVPFLFLTGYGGSELPKALPEAETVLKPFHPPELLGRLTALLEARAVAASAA
jgi:DNA-binding response OmpR family regulator